MWAPVESCRTIEGANYAINFGEESKDGNEELNGDATEDAKAASEEPSPQASTSAATASTGDPGEDESRATALARLTTKERIQQMKT